jgi:hypothetical protein
LVNSIELTAANGERAAQFDNSHGYLVSKTTQSVKVNSPTSSFGVWCRMGNNCCHGQSEPVLDFETEDVQAVPGSSVTRRPRHDDFRNPQQKINEYQEILRENQMDSLNKMRENLKKRPEVFLLNNVILAIQFFDNFDR